MSSKCRNPLADDIAAGMQPHRPIPGMLDGKSFEKNVGGIEYADAVSAAIIFFALGIVAVGAIDERGSLTGNCDVTRVENTDDRVVPRGERLAYVAAGRRLLSLSPPGGGGGVQRSVRATR